MGYYPLSKWIPSLPLRVLYCGALHLRLGHDRILGAMTFETAWGFNSKVKRFQRFRGNR